MARCIFFVLLLRFIFCTYLMYSQKTNLNLLIKNLIIEGWMMKRTGILTITIMITDIMCFYLIEEITASRYSYKTAFLNSSKKFWEVNGFQNSFFSGHLQRVASVGYTLFAKMWIMYSNLWTTQTWTSQATIFCCLGGFLRLVFKRNAILWI